MSVFRFLVLLACAPDKKVPPSVLTPINAEAVLALGGTLNFSNVDMYELELIDGVSDTLARNLLERRKAILSNAARNGEANKARPFELAHGVGPKTAKKLKEYLRLD